MSMKRFGLMLIILVVVASFSMAGGKAEGQEGSDTEPIRIGASLALTGNLGSAGKSILLAWQICLEDWNAKGGVLGRPVELVYYDDHSNASEVPGLYTKLITVDKVDFIQSPYGTPAITAAMPIAMEHGMVYPGNAALAANKEFNYKYYFSFWPLGPRQVEGIADLFFEAAMSSGEKNLTVAILSEDNEYGARVSEGALESVKKYGLKVVYNDRYPPSPATVDFTPVVRAVQNTGADLFFVGSFPQGTISIIKACKEVGYKPKLFGGAMTGVAYAANLTELGPLLNGVCACCYYVPEPTIQFGNVEDFLETYQSRAAVEGVDPLGYYNPPWAYSSMDTLLKAIEATGSLDQTVVGDYILANGWDSVVGKGAWDPAGSGEIAESRGFLVQWRGIESNDLSEFMVPGKQVIIAPEEYQSGPMLWPSPLFED
ncbi:MAG: amino acid ABC transporter substrate-binding protein [Spirochaetales bacterium]|nr:amino acid ABC transporter substrate-binding protein [Spirochaetales bacterium]